MELLQCVLYVALIGVASHFIGQALPRHWFDPNGFAFRSRAWENGGKIYLKLHIRFWKDKLPDASKVVKKMYRKKVNIRPDEGNLNRLLKETCVAETIHIFLILFSLGVVKIWKGTSGWFCWLLCLLGNLPFILIQRFNRPRLQAALERIQKEEVTL